MFQPMLASVGKEVPTGDDWVFEPKYDGIRIVALLMGDSIALVTRNGHDKCRQFPDVTNRLRQLSRAAKRNMVLDGELVALDRRGAPARFQEIQGRVHVTDDEILKAHDQSSPVAYIAFDILIDGAES